MNQRGRPAEGIETSPVRIHEDLATKLRVISAIRKTTSAKFLEPHIRSLIEREYAKAIKDAPVNGASV